MKCSAKNVQHVENKNGETQYTQFQQGRLWQSN